MIEKDNLGNQVMSFETTFLDKLMNGTRNSHSLKWPVGYFQLEITFQIIINFHLILAEY